MQGRKRVWFYDHAHFCRTYIQQFYSLNGNIYLAVFCKRCLDSHVSGDLLKRMHQLFDFDQLYFPEHRETIMLNASFSKLSAISQKESLV